MNERRRLALLLLGAAVVLFAVALLAHRHAAFDSVRDHSSLRRNPWGTAAWRALIERSGVPTATWDRPLTELTAEVEMLVMLAPLRELSSDELDALARWLSEGGRLIAAATARSSTGEGVFAAAPDATTRLLETFGLQAYPGPDADASVAATTAAPLTADLRAVLVPGGLRLAQSSAAREGAAEGPPVTLLGEADAAALMAVPAGRWPVIVLAEAEMLANATLRREDNVVLAANLVFAGGAPARVHFDEYHHGVRPATPEPERTVDVRPLRDAALALMAVLIVFAAGRARRFGAAVLGAEDRRARAADYVRAFAAIYARAGAAGAAAAMLHQRLRHELARAAGVPLTASTDRLLAGLARRGVDIEGLADLLARLEAAADQAPTERDLLELARQVADCERVL